MWSLRTSLLVWALTFSYVGFTQQDLLRDQYMFDLYLANPAYAGNKQGLSTALTYRKQWSGFSGAPETQTLSLHAPTKGARTGIGLVFFGDKIGARKVSTISGTYSYRIRLGKGKLSFGLDLGIQQNNYDLSKIDYRDQQDPIVENGRENNLVANVDIGAMYYTSSWYIGASIYHLSRSQYDVFENSESRQYAHLVIVAGRAIDLKDKLVLTPSAMFRATETGQSQLDLNAELKIKDVLGIVLGYRHKYGGLVMTYVKIKKKLKIGYSYDTPFNGLTNYVSGAHEVFLGYEFDIYKRRTTSPRMP